MSRKRKELLYKSTDEIKTAKQWAELGRKPKEGAKPLEGYQSAFKQAKATRYHISETEEMTEEEKQAHTEAKKQALNEWQQQYRQKKKNEEAERRRIREAEETIEKEMRPLWKTLFQWATQNGRKPKEGQSPTDGKSLNRRAGILDICGTFGAFAEKSQYFHFSQTERMAKEELANYLEAVQERADRQGLKAEAAEKAAEEGREQRKQAAADEAERITRKADYLGL